LRGYVGWSGACFADFGHQSLRGQDGDKIASLRRVKSDFRAGLDALVASNVQAGG